MRKGNSSSLKELAIVNTKAQRTCSLPSLSMRSSLCLTAKLPTHHLTCSSGHASHHPTPIPTTGTKSSIRDPTSLLSTCIPPADPPSPTRLTSILGPVLPGSIQHRSPSLPSYAFRARLPAPNVPSVQSHSHPSGPTPHPQPRHSHEYVTKSNPHRSLPNPHSLQHAREHEGLALRALSSRHPPSPQALGKTASKPNSTQR